MIFPTGVELFNLHFLQTITGTSTYTKHSMLKAIDDKAPQKLH